MTEQTLDEVKQEFSERWAEQFRLALEDALDILPTNTPSSLVSAFALADVAGDYCAGAGLNMYSLVVHPDGTSTSNGTSKLCTRPEVSDLVATLMFLDDREGIDVSSICETIAQELKDTIATAPPASVPH